MINKKDMLNLAWSYFGVAVGMFYLFNANSFLIHWVHQIVFWGGSLFSLSLTGILNIVYFGKIKSKMVKNNDLGK